MSCRHRNYVIKITKFVSFCFWKVLITILMFAHLLLLYLLLCFNGTQCATNFTVRFYLNHCNSFNVSLFVILFLFIFLYFFFANQRIKISDFNFFFCCWSVLRECKTIAIFFMILMMVRGRSVGEYGGDKNLQFEVVRIMIKLYWYIKIVRRQLDDSIRSQKYDIPPQTTLDYFNCYKYNEKTNFPEN